MADVRVETMTIPDGNPFVIGRSLVGDALTSTGLLLDGVSPGRASTPDTASLDITGDFWVACYLAMDDWTPATSAAPLTKFVTTSPQRSWVLRVNTTGTLALFWSTTGADSPSATSTAAPTVVNGQALWIGASIDVNNGASGRDIKFYTSADGETWTQLGSTVTQAGVTSVFSSTAALAVGAYNDGGSERFAGRVYEARFGSGAVLGENLLANPVFTDQAYGATSFTDSLGKVWTVDSPAVLAGGALSWEEVGGDARSIHIERGGQRTGVATTLDVGTLSLTTVNAWDPADEPTIKPNTPIRAWTETRVWPLRVTPDTNYANWEWMSDSPSAVWLPGSATTASIAADPWATGNAMIATRNGTSSETTLNSGVIGVIPAGVQVRVAFEIRVIDNPSISGSTSFNLDYNHRLAGSGGGYSSTGSALLVTDYIDEYRTVELSRTAWVQTTAREVKFSIRALGGRSFAVRNFRMYLANPQTLKAWDWENVEDEPLWTIGTDNTAAVEADPWATGDAFVVHRGIDTSAFPIKSETFTLPAGEGTFSTELRTFNPNGVESGYGYLTLRRADTDTEIEDASWAGGASPAGAADPAYLVVSARYVMDEDTEVYLRIQATNRSVAIRNAAITSNGALYEDTTLFTGNMEDVRVDFSRKGDTFVGITAADAVKQHNNVQRYGAVVEGAVGYESWGARIGRLAQSSTADVNVPAASEGQGREVYRFDPWRTSPSTAATRKDGWLTYGTLAGGYVVGVDSGLYWSRASTSGTIVNVTAFTTGEQRVITGLTVGASYRVSVGVGSYGWLNSGFDTWAVGVVGKSWGDPEVQSTPGTGGATMPATAIHYDFVATATSHTVQIAIAETGSYDPPAAGYSLVSVRFEDIVVTENLGDTILLQDVAYEGSLASHFDIATNSMGGAWWVDEDNVTQFAISLPTSDPYVALFTDVVEAGEPIQGAPPVVYYTNVGIGYDTVNVVNDLTINNHGRDAGTGDALDVTYSARDTTSSANWGPRQATIETSIYEEGIYAGSVDMVAGWILDASKDAALSVNSVTFNAGEVPAVQFDLDIYSRVQVTRNGVNYNCRVISITHDIRPTPGKPETSAWFTTLGLTKELDNG